MACAQRLFLHHVLELRPQQRAHVLLLIAHHHVDIFLAHHLQRIFHHALKNAALSQHLQHQRSPVCGDGLPARRQNHRLQSRLGSRRALARRRVLRLYYIRLCHRSASLRRFVFTTLVPRQCATASALLRESE